MREDIHFLVKEKRHWARRADEADFIPIVLPAVGRRAQSKAGCSPSLQPRVEGFEAWARCERGGGSVAWVEHVVLFLSLQMFFPVVKPPVFANWHHGS